MRKWIRNRTAGRSYKQAKKVVVGVIGGTVVLLGIALLVLPGPAFLVIPAGLAILATEFAWARLWMKKAKGVIRRRMRANESRNTSARTEGVSQPAAPVHPAAQNEGPRPERDPDSEVVRS